MTVVPTVTWTNLDAEVRAVTSDTGLLDRAVDISATFSYTFTELGI